MRKLFLLFLAMGMYLAGSSQLVAGASIGTFNIPGASNRFKGIGPTIKIEYRKSGQAMYLDASLYNKEEDAGETDITDENGLLLGEAETKAHYSIKHLQLGFKRSLGHDLVEPGFSFFLGGGIAFSLIKTTYKYTLPGYNVPDDKYNRSIFGFHFNAGAEYNIKSVIIEFKANFDLLIKPLVSGESYIITGSRLGVLIPLTKD
jgi:hypothetical protein